MYNCLDSYVHTIFMYHNYLLLSVEYHIRLCHQIIKVNFTNASDTFGRQFCLQNISTLDIFSFFALVQHNNDICHQRPLNKQYRDKS
jgi:hypothetical protein